MREEYFKKNAFEVGNRKKTVPRSEKIAILSAQIIEIYGFILQNGCT